MNFEALAAPFPPEAIHWRAQEVYERNGNFDALALAYIDARDVMDRLDAAVGPTNWTDYYDESPKGRVICKLSILIDGQWVTKSDGSGDTDFEGEKGGISGAFKRAAVKWGIGRYLYDVKKVYAPCDIAMRDGKPIMNKTGKPIWRSWKQGADAKFKEALAGVGRPTGPISDTTREWLIAQLESAQMPPATLLDHFKPADLRDLTFEQMAEAKRFIDNAKQRKAA